MHEQRAHLAMDLGTVKHSSHMGARAEADHSAALATALEAVVGLEHLTGKRLVVFAHPGFDTCRALVDSIRTASAPAAITVFTHYPFSDQQRRALGVDVVQFDRGIRRSPTALLKEGFRCLRILRAQRADVFILWYRHFRVSPDRWLLKVFASLAGARRIWVWDDRLRDCRPISRLQTLAEAPVVMVKNVMALVGVLVAAAVVGYRVRRRPARPWPTGPLRILYLRSDLELARDAMEVGGSVAHAAGVIGAFQELGHEVRAIAPGQIAGVQQGITAIVGARIRPDVPWEFSELWNGLWWARRVRQALRGWQYDVVYQRYSLYSCAGPLLALVGATPFILEANNSEVLMRQRFSRLYYPGAARTFEHRILGAADRIVAVSERAAQDLLDAGAPPDRIRVVPNGVDTNRFRPLPGSGASIRARWDLGEDPVIGFVGCFYRWHGLEYLVSSLPEVLADVPSCRLLLVGDGDQRDQIRAQVDELGLSHAVTFTGNVPHNDIPAHLAAMDVVVAPHAPWKEFFGSPIKLFEYMSVGKPIVASAVGQIADVIRDGQIGRLVPPGDVEALAATLLDLLRSPEERQRLGAAARDEAVAKHSWATRAREILHPPARGSL